ncbi:MAG: histidine kinase [Bacteroidetes bacterium]|nr:histidine kinase [Bacteroidota bacterium]
MRNRFALVILAILLACRAEAESFPGLQFRHITTANGLSSNTATCVTEDQQGFVWIGTDNGLNRWDGYRMKQYYHQETDSSSVICNRVQGLFCDSRGRLWVTTDVGVSCFLPDSNRFINYAVGKPVPYRLRNNTSIQIVEENDGTIWLTNQQDVIFRVGEHMELIAIPVRVAPHRFAQLKKQGYDGMLQDSHGREWGFCANFIYRLDPGTKQPVQTFDFARQLANASILNIREDAKGRLWVTTWGSGLWQFDPDAGALMLIRKIPALDVLEWNYRNCRWMVSVGLYSGVSLFREGGDSLHKLEWNPADPYSLSGTTFFSIYTDRRQNLWVCTNNGINYVQNAPGVFEIRPVTNPGCSDYDRATSEIPYSYFEEGNDIWLAKRYKATFLYDSSLHIKKWYTSLYPLSTTRTLWRQSAYYFYRKANELYISTDSGLVVYNTRRATSTLYFPSGGGREADLRTIVPLDSGLLLIRTFNEGLYVFNTATKIFVRHLTDAEGFSGHLRLNYLLKTSAGAYFLSSEEGHSLIRYDPERGACRVAGDPNGSLHPLLSARIYGMAEDAGGRIWLASTDGVFVYDPATDAVVDHYTAGGKMGLLFRICFDAYQNVWVNGNSGIWCFLRGNGKWINFNGQDGLPGSDFEGILARRPNGDIVAGLQGAMAIFHPGKLAMRGAEPPVVITEASADGANVLFPLRLGGRKRLDLSSGRHSFSVDFAVLNYQDVAATRYLYRLEPLMKEFSVNSNGHINFNGLAPGHYVLHVKGGAKAGELYGGEDSIEVDLAPSWYQSWSFRLASFFGVAVLVSLLVKRRIRTIRNESALKQRIAETEMQALRAQMDPHFIFNSLSSIENFIMQNEKRLASDHLNKFARLLRMILDSSRNDLVPLSKDMEALQLYIDLEQISCNNKFLYKAMIDEVLLNDDFHVPSLLIQPYVENAIVHGLMPSHRQDLTLVVIARLEADKIRYIVEDNGIGREQAMQYKRMNNQRHKSVGMEITEERIHIFNRRTKSKGSVVITDLYDEERNPRGTRVEITIKAL